MSDHAPVYSFLQFEASLCLWEHWAECRVKHDREEGEGFAGFFNRHGTVQMRLMYCPVVAAWALQVYDYLKPVRDDLDGFAYDWDIIPEIASHVDWSGRKPRLPSPRTTADRVYRALMSRHIDDITADAEALPA